MAKLRQSSFRRILVTRILLLFVPVLFIGQIVALNKARSSLLKTARQNLTESAVTKGEKIVSAIASLKTNLLIASRTAIVQSGSPTEVQEYLTQLAEMPTYVDIECWQLSNIENGHIIASTCGDKALTDLTLPFVSNGVDVKTIIPAKVGITGQGNTRNQLQVVLSVPVYNQTGKLQYALSLKSSLYKQTKNGPGSLAGSMLVIAEDGTILAYPSVERVGSNIQKHPDASRLQSVVKNAIAGRESSSNLYFKENRELVAGYTTIANPVTQQQGQKWILIAVTSVDNALLGLEEIKLILIVLTVGLIGASLLASLYLAPFLARPVEELRDYALNIHSDHAAQPIPHNFKIREFNQLAQALDQMVERLKAWAEELEIAWKEAKTANHVKSQFLATTSHELRNPLHTIINCMSVVQDGLCDSREEEIEFIKCAYETAIHLLNIINELLDISKIEAGKLSVVIELIDLRKLLQDVVNLQSINVQKKGLQLKVNLGDEPISVKADAAKLKQVLINIIGNATKFTEEGNIAIATKIQHTDAKSQVIISVTDTGLGIEPAQQHKLFRPFVMVDGGSTRKFEGTGLGLAISRNLIELMGGNITLESAGLNLGTTVKIVLPLIDISLSSAPTEKDGLDNLDSYPTHLEGSLQKNFTGVSKSNKTELNKDSCELPPVENIYDLTPQQDVLPNFSSKEACANKSCER
ncbi:sensor histidine kinase [Halotia branconii]|uniref:Circadian input-output histidine kinase CikA n=1 Tax=Halotia branconii CENA392 TaxID=1539056 RepID=A0AAJ6NQM3_9CYAN|nr:sensor histidine kinase [Halotia branconii]WGV24714.1 sensor histidine kinase [Halotia branconii CENA392]